MPDSCRSSAARRFALASPSVEILTCYARKSTCYDIEMHLLCSAFHLLSQTTETLIIFAKPL